MSNNLTAPVAHPAFELMRHQNIDSLSIRVEEYHHRHTGAVHYHLNAENTENTANPENDEKVENTENVDNTDKHTICIPYTYHIHTLYIPYMDFIPILYPKHCKICVQYL